MGMVLTLIGMSLVVTVVSAFLSSAMDPDEAAAAVPEKRQAAERPRFFQSDMGRSVPRLASPVAESLHTNV